MRNIENNIGGRFRYNSDFRDIQETALSFTEFLKSAKGNFVISGCKNGESGYVWLNGKIRYVEKSDEDCDFIVCVDEDGPDVLYGDDTSHKLYTEYKAAYSNVSDKDCISKTNGNFPTIKECLWEYLGIAKNSGNKQVVTSNVNFNAGVELEKINFNDITISIVGSEICFDSNNGNGFSLDIDEALIGVRKNGKTISKISKFNAYTHALGTVPMPALNGNSLEVLNKTNANGYVLEGKDIKNVLKTSLNIKSTEWIPFMNTKNNTLYSQLMAKQVKDKIFIRGRIGKHYITNNFDESNFDNTMDYQELIKDNGYASEVCSFDAKFHNDGNDTITNDGKIVKLKLSLKLPDGISLPSDDTLPGCMIMSLYPENYIKDNATSSDYYSLGNAQIQLGSDGFLYLIIGTGYKMYFGSQDPYVNFNYIV